jgi:hypothetical protein
VWRTFEPTRPNQLRLSPELSCGRESALYVVFVGSVHICPQARQLNHWIVPAASPTSRSLLPQLLQHCCEGRRYAGSRADVFAGIRRSEELCAFGIAFSGRLPRMRNPQLAGDSAEALLSLLGPQAFEHRGIARRLILRRPDEVAAECGEEAVSLGGGSSQLG